MDLLKFIHELLNYELMAVIILSGLFINKIWKSEKVGTAHKVFIASTIISIIYFFITGCNKECLRSYLVTYLFATSFYELFVKVLLNKLGVGAIQPRSEAKKEIDTGGTNPPPDKDEK